MKEEKLRKPSRPTMKTYAEEKVRLRAEENPKIDNFLEL